MKFFKRSFHLFNKISNFFEKVRFINNRFLHFFDFLSVFLLKYTIFIFYFFLNETSIKDEENEHLQTS